MLHHRSFFAWLIPLSGVGGMTALQASVAAQTSSPASPAASSGSPSAPPAPSGSSAAAGTDVKNGGKAAKGGGKGAKAGKGTAKGKDETATPEATTVRPTLHDLVAGSVDVPAPNLIDEPHAAGLRANACIVSASLSSDKRTLTLDLHDLTAPNCHGLGANPPAAISILASVENSNPLAFAYVNAKPVAAVDAEAVVLALTGNVVTGIKSGGKTTPLSAAPSPTWSLFWLDGTRWREIQAVGGKLTLTDDLAANVRNSSDPYKVFVTLDAAGTPTASPTRALLDGKGAQTTTGPKPPPHDWCKHNSRGYTVCLDFYDDALDRSKRRLDVFPRNTNHVVEPNSSIRVVVLRKRSATTTMELGGEEGVYSSGDRDLSGTSGLSTQAKLPNQTGAPDYDIDDQEFAPRLPGNANLTVTVADDGKEQSRTIEFVVETTYIGAVRVGASMVFGATDRSYEARAVNGSKQTEIAVKKKSAQDLELVVGYSAYLSPRGYANTSWTNFEPYVGIGVLNQGPTALQTLKSLHFGIEWEPSANFGIAATGVVRRVDRLANGYRIGSPISGDVPTVEKAELGFGLVFNLSPDFLRIAKQSGTAFFK